MDWLHAGLGWPIALVLTGMSFLGSFVTAAFGLGGGQLMLAVFASLLPAPAIIPVHGLVQLGSNAGRAAMTFRHVAAGVVGPFAVGALIGAALGGLFVIQLEPAVLQVAVGVFVLWSVAMKPPGFLRRSAGLAGAISSFLTMFFGATGPFVATFVKSLQLDRMSHTATHATLMTIQHLLKTLVFGFLGFTFSVWGGLVALLILAGLAGTYVGRHVLLKIDETRFRQSLNLILVLLALRLIYAGGRSLLMG
ncbi:MAG: hypothetical protein CML68_18395 [Rhodobacteraceae bacterium]|nr:hypothetical protein [Paracoccaceae bacterium]